MTIFYKFTSSLKFSLARFSCLIFFACLGNFRAMAQCPPNIDFESGTFTGWQPYAGSIQNNSGVISISPSAVLNNRLTMLSAVPGDGIDYYGRFPVNCPNGSGHSIKLGNSNTGREVDGVSYTFTIPAGQNKFSLIYYYAVVVQDGGSTHPPAQQPRFNVEITNETDGGAVIGCSSFSFVANSSIPGFQPSIFGTASNPILYKDWSAASITLDGNAGKTIKLFFQTTDCSQGGHFGYAYVDVNTECSSSFVGATFCHDDTTVNVTAPYGYQSYKWFNSSFTQVLGTSQILNFTPPPPPGTTVAVQITPYNGYGCLDTLYAQLVDTLTVTSAAGRDTFSCNHAPVQIGTTAKTGIVYKWTPVAGLSDPNISNPIATPDIATAYVVTTSSAGGGCISTDTVMVGAAVLNNTLTLIGSPAYCSNSGDSSILKVADADSIQWYRNGIAIPGATDSAYRVTQTGTYSATVFSFAGCNSGTVQQQITINPSPAAGFTINNPAQCFLGHQFDLTNTSTVSAGTLQYSWDFGDATSSTLTNVSHTYNAAGTYEIKLFATATGGCVDSIKKTIQVLASPDTVMTLVGSAAYCENRGQSSLLKVNPAAGIQWFKDNAAIPGATQTEFNVIQSGAYFARLTSSSNCVLATRIQQVDIYPSPTAAFSINNAAQCFTNNQFNLTNGSSVSSGPLQYSWTTGDGNIFTSTDVAHSYAAPGIYAVKLLVTADHGCTDTVSRTVTIHEFPTADFSLQPICINLKLPVINKTINNTTSQLKYAWEFGNGAVSTDRDPIYSYPVAGSYTVRLQVSTTLCPQTIDTMELVVNVDEPVAGITYPVKNAVINFPEPLQARTIGVSAVWTPANNLNTRGSYSPIFRGLTDQLYTVQLTTATGCVTVDTQLVKTFKKVEIYVPTVFTPGSDGRNDLLRPLLMSFKEVHYFRIFDRWGKMLFEMKSDRPGWDGTVKGIPQEMQTVIWMIEAVDVDGKVHTKKGSTLLMR